jgi:hypothetical protein
VVGVVTPRFWWAPRFSNRFKMLEFNYKFHSRGNQNA